MPTYQNPEALKNHPALAEYKNRIENIPNILINGKKNISSIDLTKSDFLVSENYQIISGDIILVNPNSTRVKNAGLIGNSGTLLSLLSFLLSSIIVITR